MEGSGSTSGAKIGPIAEVYEEMIRKGNMPAQIRLSFCERMRQAYNAVPQYIPFVEPGTSIIDQIRGHPGKDSPSHAPPDSEYPPPGSGEPFDPSISLPHIILVPNPYRREILEKAADAGCAWAIQELKRATVVEGVLQTGPG